MKKTITPETILACAVPILLLLVGLTFKGNKDIAPTIRVRPNPEPIVIDLPDFKNKDSVDRISWFAYSPNGRKLALANSSLVRVYNATTNAKICDLATTPSSLKPATYPRPSWSDDSRHIVALCSNSIFTPVKSDREHPGGFQQNFTRRFTVWDAQNGALKSEVVYGQRRYSDTEYLPPQSLRFTAYDKRLFGEEAPKERFDADGERLKLPDGKLTKYEHLYYNEALGQLAVMGEKGHSVQVIDTKNKKILWKAENLGIQSMRWDDNILSVVAPKFGIDNKLLLWDGKTRNPLPSPPKSFDIDFGGYYAYLQPDVMLFSVAEVKYSRTRQPYWQYVLIAWDFRQNRELWRTKTKNFLNSLQVSPDGKWISGIAYDGFDAVGLHLFDSTGIQRAAYRTNCAKYIWSPNNRHIAMLYEPEQTYGNDKIPQLVIYDLGKLISNVSQQLTSTKTHPS